MFTHLSILYKIFEQHPIVCTDTRDIKKGSIFFALKGTSFNGNEFAKKALESGCSYAVIDEEKYQKDDRFLLVPDVLELLQGLANYHRRMLNIPVIAITGSNGKTTTKELIASVLGKKHKTLATKGNLNNHIGVPLTLLSITKQHEMAVVEMGANHVGEIEDLCAIAEPNYGIITNIGRAHLEGFGGFEGVIKAKTELYSFIKKTNGVLFVNAGNELLMKHAEGIKNILYGDLDNVDTSGMLVAADPFLHIRWKNKTEVTPLIRKEVVSTKLIGNYNFENILAAACIGNHFNVPEKQIAEALENYSPDNSRSQVIEKGSNKIILDAYNANPTSMRAAIENFAGMNWPNKILVLGDMLELGTESAKEHQAIIDLLKQKEFSKIILVGKLFCAVNNTINAECFESTEKASEWFRKNAPKNSSLLIKGSRGIKLEKILEVI